MHADCICEVARHESMKTAVIVSCPASSAPGYVWKWRARGGTQESSSTFVYFYDCVQDARSSGYAVDLPVDSPRTVGGRDRNGLA
jgi:hypothetical protein